MKLKNIPSLDILFGINSTQTKSLEMIQFALVDAKTNTTEK